MERHNRFRFGATSNERLSGVHPLLKLLCVEALHHSEIDFGITEGLRTTERQQELYAAGKTKTLNSRHLLGCAVDVAAYRDGKIGWTLELYDSVARAFQMALTRSDWRPNFRTRWGGAWHIGDLATQPVGRTPHEMRLEYEQLRRSQGRTPFVDAVHFEIFVRELPDGTEQGSFL